MIEGGTSRNFIHLKQLMYDDPATLHNLLDKLSDTVILYLNAQIAAGADVVQLFDTWAGILPLPLYQQFVLPYHQKIISQLNRQHVPVILYVNRSAHVLGAMAQACPDVVSVDDLTPLAQARDIIPQGIALQGNLDPVALFAKPDVLLKTTLALLNTVKPNSGYIFNLGHGILPKTPVDNVRLVVDTVKAYRPALVH
jgi:uroporphyrinogen decarboxylase